MTTKLIVLFTLLLLTLTLSHSRPTGPKSVTDQLNKNSKGNNNKNDKGYGSGGYFGPRTGSVPGTGFGLPGFTGKDWGCVVRPTVVCKQKGYRYMEKLRCPTECFKYFSRPAGRYRRAGGCTIECRKKCGPYC